jgi:hypothetical protein
MNRPHFPKPLRDAIQQTENTLQEAARLRTKLTNGRPTVEHRKAIYERLRQEMLPQLEAAYERINNTCTKIGPDVFLATMRGNPHRAEVYDRLCFHLGYEPMFGPRFRDTHNSLSVRVDGIKRHLEQLERLRYHVRELVEVADEILKFEPEITALQQWRQDLQQWTKEDVPNDYQADDETSRLILFKCRGGIDLRAMLNKPFQIILAYLKDRGINALAELLRAQRDEVLRYPCPADLTPDKAGIEAKTSPVAICSPGSGGALSQKDHEKRLELTMSGQDLLRQARMIVADCPQWEIPANGKTLDLVPINNGGQWCRRVARWTDCVLHDRQWGPMAHARLNQPLRFIQAESEERHAYEAVMKLLRQERERPFKLPDPLSEHERTAHALIGGRLADPHQLCHALMPAINVGFRRGGPARINPILTEVLTALDQTRRWRNTYEAVVKDTDWTRVYERLRTLLESEENNRANPWTWLGVDMLSCRGASRCDVFEDLPVEMQHCMGIAFFSGNIGPTPQAVATLRDALGLVLSDMEKTQSETGETGPAAGAPDTANKDKPNQPKWKRIMQWAEEYIQQHLADAPTGFNALLRLVKEKFGECGAPTLRKAIAGSPVLQVWERKTAEWAENKKRANKEPDSLDDALRPYDDEHLGGERDDKAVDVVEEAHERTRIDRFCSMPLEKLLAKTKRDFYRLAKWQKEQDPTLRWDFEKKWQELVSSPTFDANNKESIAKLRLTIEQQCGEILRCDPKAKTDPTKRQYLDKLRP